MRPIPAGDSLVGTIAGDQVGDGRVTALGNGNYAVKSTLWDRGSIVDAGAVTLAAGSVPLTGTIVASNSVRGTAAVGGANLTYLTFDYDAVRQRLVVGRLDSNIVSLCELAHDLIFANGFE